MRWVSTFLQRLAYGLLDSAAVQKKIAAAAAACRGRYGMPPTPSRQSLAFVETLVAVRSATATTLTA